MASTEASTAQGQVSSQPAAAGSNGSLAGTAGTTSDNKKSSEDSLGRTCNAPGCSQQAKLQCPTCLKLQVPVALPLSFFCSQTCFKAVWADHKVLHGLPLSIPESELRDRGAAARVLTPEQIEKMRTVCRISREVLDLAAAAIRPGVTADELDRIVHEATIARNAYPSPLNYNGFPKSVCTSVNEVICHGIPDLRPLQDGDIVNLDVSLYYDGFHGDLNETYFVGNVSQKAQKLVNTSRECLEKAIQMEHFVPLVIRPTESCFKVSVFSTVKPGTAYRDIGAVIQQHAQSAGFSVVRTYCGHGINWLCVISSGCEPRAPMPAWGHASLTENKAVGVMKPGHVFTIEPMISEGTWEDDHWPDQWTAVTRDGKLSAQFEQTLLVTETGVEILTAAIGHASPFSSVALNEQMLARSAPTAPVSKAA